MNRGGDQFRDPMSNPFAGKPSNPGDGIIHLALLPPNTPRLRTVQYQYPLKLISPSPVSLQDESRLIHTVYLLTYGGGIVAGDKLDLNIIIEATTRLILLTQGSTKIFKSPSRGVISQQYTSVRLDPDSALCYLPDPVQPFEDSCFEQHQVYKINDAGGNLCVLDWVCNGRAANGEDWSFRKYSSRNEIFMIKNDHQTLLLRDNMVLEKHDLEPLNQRMHKAKVFGTLLLYGDMIESLADFFMHEFREHPRIGGRRWDNDEAQSSRSQISLWRAARHERESEQGLLWSAASLRGCTIVKFTAKEIEHGRQWLHDMLIQEGTVVRCFGERSLLCLR